MWSLERKLSVSLPKKNTLIFLPQTFMTQLTIKEERLPLETTARMMI